MARPLRDIAPLLALIISMPLPTALADEIILRTGRRIEGLVVEETASKVTIDTRTGSIRHSLTFSKAEITSLVRRPLPVGYFDQPGTPEPPAPTAATATDVVAPAYYLEIPLVGIFGEDFDETGVKDALTFARQKGVRTILFVLNSPGGHVEAAERIAGLLDEHLDWFTYHCRIKQALSASMWVVTRCHHLYVDPGATMGAAVIFSLAATGQIDVDAKLNSAAAANLVSAAARTGVLPPALIRATILRAETCYAVQDEFGRWTFIDTPPPAGANARQLDTPQTILTLAAEQLAEFGLAQFWAERTTLLPDTDKLLNRYGEAAIRRSRDRAQELSRARQQIQELPAVLAEARAVLAPDLYADYRYEHYPSGSGSTRAISSRLTAESAALKAQRQAEYRRAWQSVASYCQAITRTLDKHSREPLPDWTTQATELLLRAKREADRKSR